MTVFADLLVKDAELELCKDDNEQLMTQYEREKHLRRSAEQVCCHFHLSVYKITQKVDIFRRVMVYLGQRRLN